MTVRGRIRGFSLVELSVTLVVLGFLAIAVTAYLVALDRADRRQQEGRLLARAEGALLAFAYTNGRLPCPATDAGGDEACGGARQKGFLPWRTLGLPDAGAGGLRYGVYRDAGAERDLASLEDRFRPLQMDADGDPVDAPVDPASANLLDACFALQDLARTAREDSNRLHVASDGSRRNVAYAVAAPGPENRDGAGGGRFDGRQPLTDPVFDWPGSPGGADNDDRVVAAPFDAVADHLACSQGLAAIGHTHFNALIGAEVMARASDEYIDVSELRLRAAEARELAAGADIALASGQILVATADEIAAIGGAVGTLGPRRGRFIRAAGLAGGAIAAAGAAEGLAIAGRVAAQDGRADAQNRLEDVEDLNRDIRDALPGIRQRAEDADAGGF